MTAGIRIFNGAGAIQITDAYKSACLVAKGTVTLGSPMSATGAGGTWTTGNAASILVPVSVSPNPPYIALCSPVSVVMFQINKVGADWKVDICATQGESLAGTIVEYFAFGDTPDTVNATGGLKVMMANGACAFSSALLPLRITDYQAAASGTANFTLPSGRKLAILPLVCAYSNTAPAPAGTWTTYFFANGILTSGNTGQFVNMRYMRHQNSINIGSQQYTNGYAALAVDVTNY